MGLEAVNQFCDWSGMRVNIDKTRSSGRDFGRKKDIDLKCVTYQNKTILQIPSHQSFKYLGIRVALTQNWEEEKAHVYDSCKALLKIVQKHSYLP